jgi:acyl-homoserine lactone synthase
MIDCVSLATSHHFSENLLVAQHKLRYQEVIQKENWGNIYTCDGMEFDRYDNLATEYYIARNNEGKVVGVTRSYPTTIPYMLSEAFTFLSPAAMPVNQKILEASRLVLDRSLLTKEQRQPVVDELILAYMERGLQRNIDAYVGFMLPKIWASTFQRVGWDIMFMGPETALPVTNEIVRAALMPVSEQIHEKMRAITGIEGSVLNFGADEQKAMPGPVIYSHMRENTPQKPKTAAVA